MLCVYQENNGNQIIGTFQAGIILFELFEYRCPFNTVSRVSKSVTDERTDAGRVYKLYSMCDCLYIIITDISIQGPLNQFIFPAPT